MIGGECEGLAEEWVIEQINDHFGTDFKDEDFKYRMTTFNTDGEGAETDGAGQTYYAWSGGTVIALLYSKDDKRLDFIAEMDIEYNIDRDGEIVHPKLNEFRAKDLRNTDWKSLISEGKHHG